jgi:hypothetical protein
LAANETGAKILGYAGLIPFVVFTAGSWVSLPYVDDATAILLSYAAVILSFMGAIHWGLAMANNHAHGAKYFIASVIPALLAWLALLLSQPLALALLLLGFIGLLIYDRRVEQPQHMPDWYIPMRLRLTFVVALCLAVSLFAVSRA